MSSRLAAIVAAGVLAVTGLATGPAHAATAPTVTATPECGKVTITAVNPTQYGNLRLQYQAGQGTIRTVLLAAGGAPTIRTVEFPEDTGTHRFRWRLWGGPERDWDQPAWNPAGLTDWHPSGFNGQWAQTVRVDSDCQPVPVRAEAPTVVQPECDTARGKLVIPSQRGVRYWVQVGNLSRVWRAGEHEVLPGVYRVVAEAKDGFKLVGRTEWRRTVEVAAACPSPSPSPTVTPTVTVSPTPTDSPEKSVSPKAPALTQATCDDKTASIAIPEQDGVIYKTGSGSVLEGGKSYSVDAGSVTIAAEAADGYVLADGASSEWTLVVSDTPDCPTATPTTGTRVVVVGDVRVPVRVDTGFGGLAR